MAKLRPKDYRVRPDRKIDLAEWPTAADPAYDSKDEYKDMLARDVARLSDLQERLYATASHAVLIIFQAMDAAGKDGAIRHVMSGVNPQGCQVTSFKHPTAAEAAHDFLWRTACALPARGRIGIFNRSYYEEVLITRVHPEILRGEGLPDAGRPSAELWHDRYRSITDHERHLHRNGTRIVKFFLHISKEEQRKRLLARIDEPDKNWKFDESDLNEREHWDGYMGAYADCLAATSTKDCPWYAVPADDKENARLIVARIIVETLERLALEFPAVTPARRQELLSLRSRLTG